MSSTIRTHSNTLSLEDRIKYQQAVDRKAQKLMPSTDDEIKQTSADTAKVLSHESKEAATQNPYTEFTEKFRSWFDGNVSKGLFSEEGHRAAEEFIEKFDSAKTLDGLGLLTGGGKFTMIDSLMMSFLGQEGKSFSENLQLRIISKLCDLGSNDSDYLQKINTVLGNIAESTNSLEVAEKLASLKKYNHAREFLCDNKILSKTDLEKAIKHGNLQVDDNDLVRRAARDALGLKQY